MRKTRFGARAVVLALLALAAPLLFSGCQSSGGNPPATAVQTQDALIGLAATAACDNLTHGHPERVGKAMTELDAAEALLTAGTTYAAIEELLLRSIRADPRAIAYVQGALVLLRAQFPDTGVALKPGSLNLAHVQAGISGCRAGLQINAPR